YSERLLEGHRRRRSFPLAGTLAAAVVSPGVERRPRKGRATPRRTSPGDFPVIFHLFLLGQAAVIVVDLRQTAACPRRQTRAPLLRRKLGRHAPEAREHAPERCRRRGAARGKGGVSTPTSVFFLVELLATAARLRSGNGPGGDCSGRGRSRDIIGFPRGFAVIDDR
ncbi:unnamed protein product, partial [Ectocarpus sp. 12 AP-2014]